MALLLGQRVAVPDLIVVRRQLLQELADAVLLAHAVQVGHPVFWETAEVEVHLQNTETTLGVAGCHLYG